MISVIMTAYNRAHLLPRAIGSLLAQSCADWELVVVDDGSTDATAGVAADFARRDGRIRVVSQANTGLAWARNAGIAVARGEWLTFLDSDDEYDPPHLQLRLSHVAARPGVDMLHGGLRIVGGPDTVPDRANPGAVIRIADCFVGGTFFMRRAVPGALGGFRRPDFGDDYDFMLRARERFVIERVDFPTYVYHRDTPDGMCNMEARRRGQGDAG